MSEEESKALPFSELSDAETDSLRRALLRALQPVDALRRSHSVILDECKAMGVDLATSRVRVGFTRGHLMQIVVLIPWDVEGSDALLQDAAEFYLEGACGAALLDRWVSSVDVDRIARARGLVMVQDSQQAMNYPLSQVVELVESGIAAVQADLPTDIILEAALESQGWTALEARDVVVRPLPLGPAERLFASTCQPEALKAIMEGLPFSSARFCRGGLLLAWVGCEGRAGSERLQVGDDLVKALEKQGARPWRIVGTGFGRAGNYVDLWLPNTLDCLQTLAQALASVAPLMHFGYYDDALSDWRLVLEKGKARRVCPSPQSAQRASQKRPPHP